MIEVIAVNISPEMGERIVISGLRDSILEVFPEIGERGGEQLSKANFSCCCPFNSRNNVKFLFYISRVYLFIVGSTLQDPRLSLAWNTGSKYVIR